MRFCLHYDEPIQAAQILPLAFGITPPALRPMAANILVQRIAKDGYALTTGFHSTRYLCSVLADYGYSDLIVKLFHRTEYLSWNYMLENGATNITESWRGMREPDRAVSMSHFSLGSVVAFFFEYLGGIRIDASAPGLSHVILSPVFLPEIGDCRVTYRTPLGTIVSEWHYEDGKPIWQYSVPDGMTVEIR